MAAAATGTRIRIPLPKILPIGPAFLLLVITLSPFPALVASGVIESTDAYGTAGICVAGFLIAHLIRPGSLEFDLSRQTVRFVSIVRRRFNVASVPIMLEPIPAIQYFAGSELLICKDEGLPFSIRLREPDGHEQIVCHLYSLTYREANSLARSIEESTGLRTRLRARSGDVAADWSLKSDRIVNRNILISGLLWSGLILAASFFLSRR